MHLLTDKPARLYGFATAAGIAEARSPTSCASTRDDRADAASARYDDLPGGASRIVAESQGVKHVFVNGTAIVHDSAYTGATPGTLLRSGRDTQPSTQHPRRPDVQPKKACRNATGNDALIGQRSSVDDPGYTTCPDNHPAAACRPVGAENLSRSLTCSFAQRRAVMP